jgi:hypothetical protein
MAGSCHLFSDLSAKILRSLTDLDRYFVTKDQGGFRTDMVFSLNANNPSAFNTMGTKRQEGAILAKERVNWPIA